MKKRKKQNSCALPRCAAAAGLCGTFCPYLQCVTGLPPHSDASARVDAFGICDGVMVLVDNNEKCVFTGICCVQTYIVILGFFHSSVTPGQLVLPSSYQCGDNKIICWSSQWMQLGAHSVTEQLEGSVIVQPSDLGLWETFPLSQVNARCSLSLCQDTVCRIIADSEHLKHHTQRMYRTLSLCLVSGDGGWNF